MRISEVEVRLKASIHVRMKFQLTEIIWKYFVAFSASKVDRQEWNLGWFDNGARWKIVQDTNEEFFHFKSIKLSDELKARDNDWPTLHAHKVQIFSFLPSLGHVASAQWRNQNYCWAFHLIFVCRFVVEFSISFSFVGISSFCVPFGAWKFVSYHVYHITQFRQHKKESKIPFKSTNILWESLAIKKSNRDEMKENVKKKIN